MADRSDLTTILWRADDSDVQAVRAAFVAGVQEVAPALLDHAEQLLGRLARPNWTLEWYLPRWLGEAFGLTFADRRSLMLSNLYGLAYVRLHDDLADGESPEGERRSALALTTTLYHLWVDEYVRQFGQNPAFWDRFRTALAQWIEAGLEDAEPAADRADPLSPEGKLALARRGAPLKICCAGACLLANRTAQLGALETAIDHLLAAAVLLDHAADWAADLAAGRYNAFVAYASALPQDAAHREANRKGLLEEIYAGQAARPYYAAIRDEIRAADRIARAIPCEGLVAFLAWLDAEACAGGERLAAGAQAHLQAVVAQLFGVEAIGR